MIRFVATRSASHPVQYTDARRLQIRVGPVLAHRATVVDTYVPALFIITDGRETSFESQVTDSLHYRVQSVVIFIAEWRLCDAERV